MIRHAIAEGLVVLRQRWVVSVILALVLGVPVALAGVGLTLHRWLGPVADLSGQKSSVAVLLHPQLEPGERRRWVAEMSALLPLTSYTIGAVGLEAAWQSAAPSDAEEDPALDFEERLRQSRLRFESARRSSHPNMVELAPQLAEAMGEFPFEQGLDRILESLGRELDRVSSGKLDAREERSS